MIIMLSVETADPIDLFIVMIQKIKSGKMPKSEHNGRIDHNIRQVVPDADNTVGEKYLTQNII